MASGLDRRRGSYRGLGGRTAGLGSLALTVLASLALTLPAGASASSAVLPHGLGLIPTPSPQASPRQIQDSLEQGASLPASVSLTADAMPVGNQGEVGSCAAWSSDYSALGYWENKEGIAGGGLEPMYTYSQVDGGVDDGSSIEGNLQVDETQGVDTQSDYWQGNFDYSDQPTAAEQANAVNWKLSGYSDLPIDQSTTSTATQTGIETALADGDPVVIGIPVYDNFFDVGTADNGYYASPSGDFDGYHAIAALGYNSQGLVIENSWGTGWGDAGYATLSWSFVNEYVFDAVEVGPLVTGQPVNTAAPTVSGTAGVGDTLTAQPGSWSPSATSYSYQWQSAPAGNGDWSPVSGATSATFVPTSALQGDQLRVFVTASNGTGPGAMASASATVGGGSPVSTAPVNTAAPTVTGTLTVGQTLSAGTGTWSPAGTSYAFQWQRSTDGGSTWTSIGGATGASYVLQATDQGAELRVQVTATNSSGSASAVSAATGSVAPTGPTATAPVNSSAPAITGTAARGSTLTASTGTWSPAPTSYSYAWQLSTNKGSTWETIPGATATTFTPSVGYEGYELRVLVTAANASGASSAASAPTSPVAKSLPAAISAPTITGTAAVGDKLTATTGTWSGVGNTYSFQWQHSTNGSSWTNITAAAGSTYTLRATDASDEVRVVVTAHNPDGAVSDASAATTPLPAAAKKAAARKAAAARRAAVRRRKR